LKTKGVAEFCISLATPPRQQLQIAALKMLLVSEYHLFWLCKKGSLSLECIIKLR